MNKVQTEYDKIMMGVIRNILVTYVYSDDSKERNSIIREVKEIQKGTNITNNDIALLKKELIKDKRKNDIDEMIEMCIVGAIVITAILAIIYVSYKIIT